MSHNAILEIPNVTVVRGAPGQSFLVVETAADLAADIGREGDRAVIRTTGDEWLKTAGAWAATGANFWGTLLPQASDKVELARRWAEEAPDVEVDGGFSALHWAGRAAAVAAEFGDLDAAMTAIDQAVSSAAGSATTANTNAGLTATDRAATAADVITTAATLASTQAARDAALATGKVYADTTAGLAAVAEGEYFLVPSGDTLESLILYRDLAGVATEIKRFASTAAVELSGSAATLAELSEALQYDDSGIAIALDAPLPSILIKDAASPAKRYFGSVIPKLTATRTTAGWYFDKLGLLKQAGVNVPRFTHDFKSLAPRGLLCEPARVNRVLWNRDLTNAAWVKSNITAALNQVGLDGIAASASSITATAADATVLQAITIASAAYFQTAYIKRLAGAGAIFMTMDGGATWADVTPPDSYWNRMSIPTQTLANPNVGFKIDTSGDSFAIDLVQNENGNYRTSPMVTTTAFFSRGADLISMALSGLPFNVALGSLFMEGRTQAPDNVSRIMAQIDDGTNSNKIAMAMSSLGGGQLSITTAGAVVANVLPGITVVDKPTRMAGSWGSNYAQAALDGSVGAQDNALTVPPGLATLRIGGGLSGTSPFGGTISRIALRLRTQDATELTAMSNFGAIGVEPLVDVVPNDAKIEDSDYAAVLTATSSQVSGVRPISSGGYQYANPGWRRRFKTRALSVVLHFQNLNLVGGSYNGKGQILVDGVHHTYFTSPQALGKFVVRLDFTSNSDRLIEIVMPHSASIAHLGITTYGAPITLPTPRSTLPRAAFLGDSRLQGFNATSVDKTWMEILCRAKGWQHINLGYGSSTVTSAWGTDLGNANPDVAFVMFDYNNRSAQTSLLGFKNAYKSLITNFRTVKPTTKLYAVTSNWISAAQDALTLKIADYRQAAADALTELADANNILIDGLTLTANSTASIGDGIHPNDVGEAELAANIAPLVSV